MSTGNAVYDAILEAFERGLKDGYYKGVESNPYNTDTLILSYRKGYDSGIRMYLDSITDDADVAREI
jgi:hypothetical protein